MGGAYLVGKAFVHVKPRGFLQAALDAIFSHMFWRCQPHYYPYFGFLKKCGPELKKKEMRPFLCTNKRGLDGGKSSEKP
jgi:hypothetical protein